MTEKTLSITSVRQNLLKLTKTAKRRMDRYILTNKGEAEAVLIGYGDYKSLLAAAELALRPEVIMEIHQGIAELKEGKGLSLEEAQGQIMKARRKAFRAGGGSHGSNKALAG